MLNLFSSFTPLHWVHFKLDGWTIQTTFCPTAIFAVSDFNEFMRAAVYILYIHLKNGYVFQHLFCEFIFKKENRKSSCLITEIHLLAVFTTFNIIYLLK